MMRAVGLILICLLSQANLYSQDNRKTSNKNDTIIVLEEFSVVESNRLQLPFMEQNRDVLILPHEVIQSLPVKSINELLGYISGIDVKQRGPWGGQADIAVNGGTFDQTLVLLNGMKVIDPQTGHNMMNLPIPVNAIERIEVLKGTAASRYGINALNGVINIVTKNPDKSGVQLGVELGSSFDSDTSNLKIYKGLEVNFLGTIVKDKSEHLLAISAVQTNGHRYNTEMNNNKLFYQNQIHLKGNNHLQMMVGGIYNEFGSNGFYAAPADVESKETVQTIIGSIKGDFQVNSIWKILPSISYRYNKDDYIFIRTNPEVYRNIHTTNVMNITLDNSIKTTIGIVGFGLEYRSEFINSNSLGNWNRDNYGLYGEFAFDKVENLSINAGAYLNYSEHFKFKVLPSLDASYKFAKFWQIYASAGTGTRIPTYTDWYYDGPGNIGNSNLTPENAFSTEGGVRFLHSGFKVGVNYFYREVSDIIDWVKNDINDPWETQNFQEVKMHGASASFDYQMITPKTEKGISLLTGVSYTWLNPIMTKDYELYTFSNYTLENLKDQFVARFNIGFLKDYNFSINGRYEKRVNYKDYFLLDSKISGEWGGFKLYVSLNNITNVTYIEAGAVPLPGLWFSMGLTWSWWEKK